MKIISCDCFEQIAKTLEEQNKRLEIEETVITDDMDFKKETPFIYFKMAKKNVKKKEYVSTLAKYCPFCGKEIKTGITKKEIR